MNQACHFFTGLLLAATASLAQGANMQLTLDMPDCRMPSGKPLPEKYQALSRKNKEFAWVRQAKPGDYAVNGNGWESIDGSSIHTWFAFSKIDLDNDGTCDWYLHVASPLSSGGDRDSINTLYLGRKTGWLRVGATVPADKPDELGFGKTNKQQAHYLFGEEVSVIHDAKNRMNYLVSAFYNRHVQRDSMPGYRILAWDAGRNTLRPLDKWEPGSQAAEVYAFFKAHGARLPAAKTAAQEDTVDRFDEEIEQSELKQACNPDSPQRSSPELYGAVSRHLLARCKRSGSDAR